MTCSSVVSEMALSQLLGLGHPVGGWSSSSSDMSAMFWVSEDIALALLAAAASNAPPSRTTSADAASAAIVLDATPPSRNAAASTAAAAAAVLCGCKGGVPAKTREAGRRVGSGHRGSTTLGLGRKQAALGLTSGSGFSKGAGAGACVVVCAAGTHP